MYGQKHTDFSKSLLSDLNKGSLNPMFSKKHADFTKKLISDKKSKNTVELYNINSKKSKVFNNNVEVAQYLSVHKSTIGKYIKTGQLFKELYLIKVKTKQN